MIFEKQMKIYLNKFYRLQMDEYISIAKENKKEEEVFKINEARALDYINE